MPVSGSVVIESLTSSNILDGAIPSGSIDVSASTYTVLSAGLEVEVEPKGNPE